MKATTVDHIKFEIANPSQSCVMREQSSGNTYSSGKTYETRSYKGSSFTHVRISFTSGDPGFKLLGATSTDSCTKSNVSPSGRTVSVEIRLNEKDVDCKFDWALVPGSPPCTLTIVIKKS